MGRAILITTVTGPITFYPPIIFNNLTNDKILYLLDLLCQEKFLCAIFKISKPHTFRKKFDIDIGVVRSITKEVASLSVLTTIYFIFVIRNLIVLITAIGYWGI